jgi:nucleotide-binding universal stress UspA family protein
MTKILVPVDGSEQSCEAAKWAVEWATEAGGSVTLLHVHVMPGAEVMAMAHLSREKIEEIETRHAGPSFQKARDAAGDAGIADTLIAIGDAGEEIVGIAHSKGFDHIVMGSRGLTPLKELLLGSVSEHVIRKAPCPVTIIR